MSISHALIAAVLLGCRSVDPPSTSYFSDQDGLEALDFKLVRKAHAIAPRILRATYDSSAPTEYASGLYLRLDWYRDAWWPRTDALDPKKRFLVGTFDIQIMSNRDQGGRLGRVCGLRIGPNHVRGPFPVDFIYDLFDDPELAVRVRSAVGAVDLVRPYEIETMVDGFRIYLAQHHSGHQVEIVIDGCGRVAPRNETHRTLQEPLEFSGVEPHELQGP